MAEVLRTTCNRDCPDMCSLLVTVEDGRAVALRGDPEDPVTKGFLCERTSRFLDRQYADDRITSPMLRVDGELVPVSWGAALDVAAEKLLAARESHGPASILHYRSGGSLGILKLAASHLFEQFGPVTIKRGDICSGAGEAAQEADFGVSESHDLFDLRNSRAIVLWGKNPHVGNVHLLPLLRERANAGVPITGIDPVRTKAAALCERFLQPRPGADHALALGAARVLYDEGLVDEAAAARCDGLQAHRDLARSREVSEWAALCDLPAAEVEALAHRLVHERPCAILLGWGLGRRRNGFATVRAIDALTVLSGNLGVPGGGISFYFARQAAFDKDFVRGLEVAPRSLSETRLGAEILAADDPPVQVAWITAGNPVSMLPDSGTVRRALQQVPFTVVVDTHPTDTTDVADLVLPTLTLLEDSDVMGAYGNHWLRVSEPAIAPPEGPRHELELLQDLASRLGLAEAMAGSIDDWKRRVTRRLEAAGAGIDAMRAAPVRNPFVGEVLFADGEVATDNGRVQLLREAPGEPPAVDDTWSLTLLAVSTSRAQSSQWSVTLPDGPPDARVHPAVGEAFGEGAEVLLESPLGRLPVRVVCDPAVRRDVVLMEKGGMLRQGRCANALVAAEETDGGGGASYYDERVRLVAR